MLNIGMILIWLSFVLGSGAAVYAVRDQFGNSARTERISKKLEFGCAVTTTLSIVLLIYYMYTVAASFQYVYLHSSTDLSVYYRVSALWAGQEGSLLLWTWAVLMMLLLMQYTGHTRYYSDSRLMGITRTISLMIAAVFLMLLVLKNPFSMYHILTGGMGELTNWNPFAIAYPIIDGLGMNPLLRNPWMAVHPPVLFLGYAAFTIPFAAALTDLLIDDDRWIQIARDWMRIAWFFLTLGIGLGGFWAYEVLGWGAWYWTWDPVETSSLIPWITATAYLHAQTRSEKDEYRFLAPMLAIVSFILVIFATFVTRSGMWVSVHSWQDFTSEGMLIALFLLVLVGSSTVLLTRRYFGDDR